MNEIETIEVSDFDIEIGFYLVTVDYSFKSESFGDGINEPHSGENSKHEYEIIAIYGDGGEPVHMDDFTNSVPNYDSLIIAEIEHNSELR